MSHIDFLVQNSTKKILDVIRGLPDRKKLEAAFKMPPACDPVNTSLSTASKSTRFTRHPRRCKGNDGFESDGDTSAETLRDEVVVIKTPRPSTSRKNRSQPCNDSSDEYCDVTVRTEEVTDFTLSLEERLGAYHLEHACAPLRTSKSKKVLKGRPSSFCGKREKVQMIKSYAEYENLLRDRDCKGSKSSKRKSKTACSKDESQSLSSSQAPYMSQSQAQSPRSSNAKSMTSSRLESQSELLFQDSKVTDCPNERYDVLPSEGHTDSKSEKVELKVPLDLKLKNMVERSMTVLKECRSIFECGIELPDGREDYERRRKRTVAFASRFSRNYVYQLIRNKIDIENIINPFGKAIRTTNSYILGQRFYNAYQTIYQALDAYRKHLPTGLVNGMPPKFRELLELIIKFNDLYKSFSDTPPEEETVLDYITECCNSMQLDQSLICSTRISSANMSTISRRRATTSISSGQQAQRRLSMYGSTKDMKNSSQAKQKYQVPSKYRTATFKHRPPPVAQPPPEEAPPKFRRSKLSYVEPLQLDTHLSESALTKKRRAQKLGIVDIDSDVCTYVQDTVNDHAIHYNTIDENYGDCGNLRLYSQEFFDKVTKGTQDMSNEEYACILDHFLEIIGEEKLPAGMPRAKHTQEMLERKFQQPIANMGFEEFVKNLILYANAVMREEINSGSPRKPFKSRATTISVTGPENAKLICVKEAQSDESSDIMSQINFMDPEGALLKKLSKLSVSQQTESNELIYKERGDDENGGLKSLKLDKVCPHLDPKMRGKCPPILPSLPKDMMLRLIEYKLQFHKDSKENFIYKRNPDFSTWLVVSKIADTIMDETLLSVTRDIQVDQILQKIYTQEFK